MDARKNSPVAESADRDFVVKEYGAIDGGKQTLDRLGEYLDQSK